MHWHEVITEYYNYYDIVQEHIKGGRVSNCTYTSGEHHWECNMTSM